MNNVLEKIERYKIVPVVTIQKIEDAAGMLDGLIKGGLPVAEICFRTDCAEEAIRFAAKKYPEMLIGAGTVINGEQCERAIGAGAKFIVSPGFSEEVAKVCREKDIPYLPGVVSPAEIMKAISFGITHLKFFPAGNFGGLNTIQAQFMPTGGVNAENMNEYLAFPKIFACGGSWMMKGDIEENCQDIVKHLS